MIRFLSFAFNVFLVCLLFALLQTVIAFLVSFLQAIASRMYFRSVKLSMGLNLILSSLVAAALVAVISSSYAGHEKVSYPWVYAIFGFFFTYRFLGLAAYEKQKEVDNLRRTWLFSMQYMEISEASATAVGLGVWVGLLGFFFFFRWPFLITWIPGSEKFLDVTMKVSSWLFSFWPTGIVLGVITFLFCVRTAFLAFVAAISLFALFVSACARLKCLLGGQEVRVRVTIDENACVGCDLCVETCPEVFEMSGNVAQVKADSVPEGLEACAKQAAEDCPPEAIRFEFIRGK